MAPDKQNRKIFKYAALFVIADCRLAMSVTVVTVKWIKWSKDTTEQEGIVEAFENFEIVVSLISIFVY